MIVYDVHVLYSQIIFSGFECLKKHGKLYISEYAILVYGHSLSSRCIGDLSFEMEYTYYNKWTPLVLNYQYCAGHSVHNDLRWVLEKLYFYKPHVNIFCDGVHVVNETMSGLVFFLHYIIIYIQFNDI